MECVESFSTHKRASELNFPTLKRDRYQMNFLTLKTVREQPQKAVGEGLQTQLLRGWTLGSGTLCYIPETVSKVNTGGDMKVTKQGDIGVTKSLGCGSGFPLCSQSLHSYFYTNNLEDL